MRTILFIDDSSIMRASIPPSLRKQDFEVIEACDGVDALGKLNAGLKPDVIITDLNMPNMDGLTFVKEARKMRTLRFVPIYVLTTEKKQEKQDEVRAAGATGWFTKANFRDELFEVLKKSAYPPEHTPVAHSSLVKLDINQMLILTKTHSGVIFSRTCIL